MLSELLSLNSIGFPLKSTTRDEIVVELLDLAATSGKISDRGGVLREVIERERVLGTTVGKGVFIPRARSSHISGFCAAFGIAPSALDFDALDGNPIELCLFLGIPRSQSEEGVEYLVRAFRLFNQDSFRSALLKATSKRQIIHIFEDEERDLER